MAESRSVTVAVDAVGGDFAPQNVLAGVAMAIASDPALTVALTGPADVVEPFASKHGGRIRAVPTTEIIEMGEHPANAVRAKKDSSIVVGCRLVKDGEADAFISAGSTGACMAAATLVMGRIKGVHRPAIAQVLPSEKNPFILLDVGANADCKPEYLLQFARMGAAYASAVLGTVHPRVALLNIGSEATKGSQLALESYELLAAEAPGFQGNVEGYDVLKGDADVIVTDGFTGNVALKLLEGTSRTLFGQIRTAMTSSLLRKLAASLLAPALRELKSSMDVDTYGGAPLLGVNGVCIISHGTSSATAISQAIAVAAQASRGDLTDQIKEAVAS